MEDWNKMTVAQLKTECSNRGLDTNGKKADLIQKLSQHEAAAGEAEEEEEAAEVEAGAEVEQEEQNGDQEQEEAEEEAEGEQEAEGEEAAGQDGVDKVIEAIDDIIETPEGEEGDGEKAEGEQAEETAKEEEKEGEKTEEKAEEKKTETKATPAKVPPVKVPIKKTVRAEVLKESRVRTVVFGPLVLEDLKNEKMLEIFKKAEQFFIRFASEGEPGHAQLRVKTFEEAKELAEAIAADPFKEDIVVKQLEADGDQNGKIDALLKGESEKTQEAIESRMLYVHNVAESVMEDNLKQLVPEALSAIIPKDDDRKSKGYAYLEFEDAAKMEEFIKKVDNLTLESTKMTLHKIPTFHNEDRPQRPRYQNFNRQQNTGGNRRDNQRGGYNRGGGRQGFDNRQQGRWNDNRGFNRGYNQGGGGSGVGGQEAVSLLMGISQMLSTQQQSRAMAPPPPPAPRGYAPQRGYDDHYGAGYADQGRKRRYEDNYGGGYNQGGYHQGGYGGGQNKRFNPGRRY